ncbi:MAG: DUF2341 domain-containing protein [Candidatus Altiarchaeota archaeon]|nr:DUF2341 domain-containing protein [Candidatus Altiarchaeota archaeon]
MKVSEIYGTDKQLLFLDGNLNTIKVTKIEKTLYSGRIYDVTVRNHIILIKRDGKPIWSGNSYSLVNSTVTTQNGTFTVTLGVLADGNYNITATTYDNATNSNSDSVIVAADTIAPTTNATAIKDDSSPYTFNTWTNSSYINITLTCDDGLGTGCDMTLYCIDASNSCEPDKAYMISWDYRQPISFLNTAGNQTDYQVKINLNSSNVGSNWNWTNNGDDIRFTYYNSSSDTEGLIPYWIESWNSTTNITLIWVNVPFMENNTNTTIYMYYGNPSAVSMNDGNATFVFFDDFADDDILDWGKGGDTSTISVSGGVVTINDPSSVTSITHSFNALSSVRLRGSFKTNIGWVSLSTSGDCYAVGYCSGGGCDGGPNTINYYGSDLFYHLVGPAPYNIFHTVEIRDATPNVQNTADYSVDLTEVTNKDQASLTASVNQVRFQASNLNDPTAYLDWILIAKYGSPEPVASLGSEENQTPVIQVTADGVSYIRFKSNDVVENTEYTKNKTIKIDYTPPNITIVNPTNNTNLSDGISWTWINISTDENASCRYNLSVADFDYATQGTTFTNTGGTTHSFNYSGLTDGQNYTLYYKCNDSTLGNINPSSVMHTFGVNQTLANNPPTKPSLNSPDNASYVNKNYAILNWTCLDSDGDNMTAYVYGDNSTATTLINTTTNCQNGTSYTYNWTNLNETTYYWKVTCNDSSLANTSDTYQFTADWTPPTTNVSAMEDDSSTYTFNTWTNSSYVNVTLNCTDPDCDTTQYCTELVNGCVPNTVYSVPVQVAAEGTTYIKFRSNDSAGNLEDIKNKTIRIDSTAPTTNATAVKDDGSPYTFDTWTNSSYVGINLNCSDSSGAGCDKTLYCIDNNNSCDPGIDRDYWNSWGYKKIIVISETDNADRTKRPIEVNVTGLKLLTDNCTKEIRVVDENNKEVPSQVIDSGGQTLPEGSQWCKIAFLVDVSANSRTSYSVYYANSEATAPNYTSSSDLSINEGSGTLTAETAYYRLRLQSNGMYGDTWYDKSHAENILTVSNLGEGTPREFYTNVGGADDVEPYVNNYITGAYSCNLERGALRTVYTCSITDYNVAGMKVNNTKTFIFWTNQSYFEYKNELWCNQTNCNGTLITAHLDWPADCNNEQFYNGTYVSSGGNNEVTNNPSEGLICTWIHCREQYACLWAPPRYSNDLHWLRFGYNSDADTTVWWSQHMHSKWISNTNKVEARVALWVEYNDSQPSLLDYQNIVDPEFKEYAKNLSVEISNEMDSSVIQITQEGASYIRYRSNDTLGNLETTQSKTIRIDYSPPQITLVYPINNTNLSAGTTWTWINISTDENAVCKYNLTTAAFDYGTQGTQFTTTGGTTHSFNYLGLSDGQNYTLYYKCNDSTVGNINPSSIMHAFGVNPTPNRPPNKPSLNSPANGAGNQNLSPTLNVTVTDPDADQMNVLFYNNATGTQIGITQVNVANGSTATVTWLNLNYGTTYGWYANATDGEYMNKSDVWSFTTRSAPGFTVNLNTPENQTKTNDNTTDFNFNVTGTETIYNCTLKVDNIDRGNNDSVQNNTPTTITSTPLTDGAHNWHINCTTGGLTNKSEIRQITVDTQPPNVTLQSPFNGSTDLDGNLTFTYHVRDNLANNLNCTLYTDINGPWQPNQSQNTTNNSVDTFTLNNTGDGVYEWNIRCSDGVNQAYAPANYEITVDTGTPELTLSSTDIVFSNPTPQTGQTITITITAHNLGGITANNYTVEFLLNGITQANKTLTTRAYSTNTTTFQWNTTLGTHTIMMALDPEDNIAEVDETNNNATQQITVSNPAPPPKEYLHISTSGNCVNKQVTITVEDDDSAPVPSVSVDVYFDGSKIESKTTGSNGQTTFIPENTGTHTIKAEKSGYEPDEKDITISSCESCTDGIKNQDESDTDCGGSCPKCGDGKNCSTDVDCSSRWCYNGVCTTSTCFDGIQGPGELGIDCGGPCTPCPSCNDSILNQDESDVDCGGSCPKCGDGKNCSTDVDCSSGWCYNGVCTTPSCFDGVMNQDETSIDCGGVCHGCTEGEPCLIDRDCLSGWCYNGTCTIPTCFDGLLNQNETGVDCGGPCIECHCLNGVLDENETEVDCGGSCPPCGCMNRVMDGNETDIDCGGECPKCTEGRSCLIDGDCTTGWCYNGICSISSCNDRIQGPGEGGIDCGGPCTPCHCLDNTQNEGEEGVDCGGECPPCRLIRITTNETETGEITTILYNASSVCLNNKKDAGETDIDCGGHCPPCKANKTCLNNTDCLSGWCYEGICRITRCDDHIKGPRENKTDCGGPCAECPWIKLDTRCYLGENLTIVVINPMKELLLTIKTPKGETLEYNMSKRGLETYQVITYEPKEEGLHLLEIQEYDQRYVNVRRKPLIPILEDIPEEVKSLFIPLLLMGLFTYWWRKRRTAIVIDESVIKKLTEDPTLAKKYRRIYTATETWKDLTEIKELVFIELTEAEIDEAENLSDRYGILVKDARTLMLCRRLRAKKLITGTEFPEEIRENFEGTKITNIEKELKQKRL